MSVWPKPFPTAPPLSGPEGKLVSVSIHVDPRCLESLLEGLAQVSFSINPQIYHEAGMVYRFADGRETAEDVTLVEFPAYDGRLDEIRRAVTAYGFDPATVHASGMLDVIHDGRVEEAPPPGADYVARYRLKRKNSWVH